MKPFLPVTLNQAEFVRNVYRLPAQSGATIEDILSPEAWVHVDRTLKLYDRIEVIAEDGSYFVDLMVTGLYPHFRVAPLYHVTLSEGSKPVEVDAKPAKRGPPTHDVPEGYDVNRTPKTKWRVIRIADGETMVRDLPTRDDALNWLADFVKADGATVEDDQA